MEHIDDISRKFNVHLSSKLIIYGDEIDAGARKLADLLKSVITREKQTVEKKGVDSFLLNDYSNYIFTTNNEHCFKMEEGDRRYFLIKCTNERLPDSFYIEYMKDLENNELMTQLFYFLKTRKIEYTQNKAPITEYKKELINEQQPAYIQYIYKKPEHYAGKLLYSTKIFEMANEYGKKTYLSTNYTVTRFGIDFKKSFGIYSTRTNGGIKYDFPELIELKKKLYELNPKYYKYINNFEDNEEPDFTEDEEIDNKKWGSGLEKYL